MANFIEIKDINNKTHFISIDKIIDLYETEYLDNVGLYETELSNNLDKKDKNGQPIELVQIRDAVQIKCADGEIIKTTESIKDIKHKIEKLVQIQ